MKLAAMIVLSLGAILALLFFIDVTKTDSISCPSNWVVILCLLRTYPELSGALITGAWAVIAAKMAWDGVQQQIAHQRELANARETQAQAAIRTILGNSLSVLNQAWRALDHTRHNDSPDSLERGIRAIRVVMRGLPNLTIINPLDELETELGPLKKWQLRDVKRSLRDCYGVWADIQDQINRDALVTLQISFSYLDYYLRTYDPLLANAFAGRERVELNHENIGELVAPFVNRIVNNQSN